MMNALNITEVVPTTVLTLMVDTTALVMKVINYIVMKELAYVSHVLINTKKGFNPL